MADSDVLLRTMAETLDGLDVAMCVFDHDDRTLLWNRAGTSRRALRDWLTKHGAEPISMTPPEFARFVLSEGERAARIVQAAGIKPR